MCTLCLTWIKIRDWQLSSLNFLSKTDDNLKFKSSTVLCGFETWFINLKKNHNCHMPWNKLGNLLRIHQECTKFIKNLGATPSFQATEGRHEPIFILRTHKYWRHNTDFIFLVQMALGICSPLVQRNFMIYSGHILFATIVKPAKQCWFETWLGIENSRTL